MFSFWLPVDCVLCGQPPVQLCRQCLAGLALAERRVTRPGLTGVVACANYAGAALQLVHAFKTTGSTRLARALAQPVAAAVAGWLAGAAAPGATAPTPTAPPTLLLVPAPSRSRATRRRGFAPAWLLAAQVARVLNAQGIQTRVRPLLRVADTVQDQSLLNLAQRRQNLVGQMSVLGAGPRGASPRGAKTAPVAMPPTHSVPASQPPTHAPFAPLPPNCHVIVVDDIVTTGSTLVEANRALAEAGLTVSLSVTFAETL